MQKLLVSTAAAAALPEAQLKAQAAATQDSARRGSLRMTAAEAERLVDSFVADLRWAQQPRVEVATSPSSTLCRTALLLLEDLGIVYRELQIGRDITEAQLVRRKGGPFVLLPLIFVDDRFVGGHAELKALAAFGAHAVLTAAEPSGFNVTGRVTPPRAASPRVFDRLHYEAESNEARRAALQRHGLKYGLHSPMSPERAPPAPRPQSPLPPVTPRLSSPGRELVSQERCGVGIRAVIRTDRAGMRHGSVHSAVRCGGGWDLLASTSLIEGDGSAGQRRSRSPAYIPRERRRRSPGRTPAAARRTELEPADHCMDAGAPGEPYTLQQVSIAPESYEHVRRHDPEPEPEPEPEPADAEPDPGPDLQRTIEGAAVQLRMRAAGGRHTELGPTRPRLESQRNGEEDAVQRRLQAVRDRLTELNSGVRLRTSSTLPGEVALLGLDGDIITSTASQRADNSGKLLLLLRMLEGACDRVEKDDDSGGG